MGEEIKSADSHRDKITIVYGEKELTECMKEVICQLIIKSVLEKCDERDIMI